MRNIVLLVLIWMLVGCTRVENEPTFEPTAELTLNPTYPILGDAPEIEGDVWINSDRPLRLTALRGRVVLIDMWTFG